MKTLTPADSFDTNVRVPEGDDEQDDHSGDTEAFVQKLLNRTEYLNARKGTRGSANTWTSTNIFQGTTQVHTTLFIDPDSASTPGIHIDASGELYQELITGRAGASNSDDRVRIYVGQNSTAAGALFFVVNARWQPGVGWSRVVSGRASQAIIMRDADVRVVGKAHDAVSPWSSWQQSTLAEFDSEVLSEVFRARAMRVTGNTDLNYTNGYRYIDAVARTSAIPLGMCWGNIAANAEGELRYGDAIDGSPVWIPIPIPPYCSFGRVRVQFYQLQSVLPRVPDQFQLYKRTHHNGWVAQGSVETLDNYANPVTIELHTGATQVVLDGDEWAYRWRRVSTDPTTNGNRIVGISVDWTDIGPSNRVG